MRITRFLLAALVFPDDGVSFIHRDETLSRVHGQHGEAHAEVRCQDIDIVDSIKD